MDGEDIVIVLYGSESGSDSRKERWKEFRGISVKSAGDLTTLKEITSENHGFLAVLILSEGSDLPHAARTATEIEETGRASLILIEVPDGNGNKLSDQEIPPGTCWITEKCSEEIILNNILARKKDLKELRQDRELFNLFLEFNPSFVFFKDHEARTLKLSRNYETMLGRPLEELLGKNMFELFPSDLARSMDADDRNILAKGLPFEVEEEFNGRFYTTNKFPIYRDQAPPLLAGFTMDITRRVKAEKDLEKLATEDPLTGIGNRRQLFMAGEILLDNAVRATVPLSVLMIDIDDFKLYNDTYGHQAGDNCLIEVGHLIKDVFQRLNDISGRFGGEEFTVILFNTNRERAIEAGDELCYRMVEKNIKHNNSSVGDAVTLSVGVTTIIPGRENTLDELIARADKGLYQAKQKGKNRCEYFESPGR